MILVCVCGIGVKCSFHMEIDDKQLDLGVPRFQTNPLAILHRKEMQGASEIYRQLPFFPVAVPISPIHGFIRLQACRPQTIL